MTNPQTEARAIAELLADYGLTLDANIVVCDRRVVDEAVTALSERDATIAAKDAELAEREKEVEKLTKALEKKHRAFIIASNQAMSNGSAAHKAEVERDEVRKESARFASQNLMLQGMVAQSEVALTCAESSLAEREAEMGREWQPMETAPKDGSRFLAFNDNGVEFFHWQDLGSNAPVGWRDNFIVVYREGDPKGPQGWMPIPSTTRTGGPHG